MRHSILLGALLGTMAAVPALAADPVKITAAVFAEKREAADNGVVRFKLVPAGHVTPGDHVVYRLSVSNNGSRPATGLVIANPVPANMQYVGPADNSPAPEVSVDGKTFGQLATLRISANGQARPASAADVRVVRWRLTQPVAAGGTGQVAFRALLK